MLVAQLCLVLCNPMDCSPLGSSVYEILQARILEWVAIPFSRGSSQTRDWTQSPALQADSLPSEPLGKEQIARYVPSTALGPQEYSDDKANDTPACFREVHILVELNKKYKEKWTSRGKVWKDRETKQTPGESCKVFEKEGGECLQKSLLPFSFIY